MPIRCLVSGGKGGTGKSTLTIASSRIARALGIKVGIIDLAFSNPSTTLTMINHAPRHTLVTYLIGISKIKDVIQEVPTVNGPIYIIPMGRGDPKVINDIKIVVDKFEELVSALSEHLHVELVIIDFPAFNAYMDKLITLLLNYCDYLHPILTQDYGSLVTTYELTKLCHERSIRLGKAVLNMVREPMGDEWVRSTRKILGSEPFIIHYDPWISRFTMHEEVKETQGIRELITFVLKYMIY